MAVPWSVRVAFAPGGGFAYRPGDIIVRRRERGAARKVLWSLLEQSKPNGTQSRRNKPHKALKTKRVGSFVRFTGIPDALDAIAKLNQAGIYAQPNHVVFAHTSDPGGVQANPFYANPFYANPFYANPFYANPFYANPFYANPFYANPFHANPFYANPFYANTNPALDPNYQQTGLRPSSARPGAQPTKKQAFVESYDPDAPQPRITILDTGYAGSDQSISGRSDSEIADVGNKGYLDPVAGHGTFIAGIIEQLVPGCHIEVMKVINPEGDGDEWQVAGVLEELWKREEDRPHFVNLSFGGYSSTGMGVMAEAIAALHHKGAVVVASAGNDATGVPMYPAALPHVVAVGALDHEGNPAPFTNYGPWVRACTLGVEVVSKFFAEESLAHPRQADVNVDDFAGWAVWSGTSFAAPRLVAALAHHMRSEKAEAPAAVAAVIDALDGELKPQLGRVVHPYVHP